MGDDPKAASAIARILGGDPKSFRALFRRNLLDPFVLVHKNVSEQARIQLLNSGLEGLVFNPNRQRVRPEGMLAVQVLGLTNAEHRGVSGVEQQMESILAGENGWSLLQLDGRNRRHSSPGNPVRQPRDGRHVVLTLDKTFQAILEEELRRGVEVYKASGGSAVLMDPYKGDVLGMASVNAKPFGDPSLDLVEGIQNRAVQIAFEPGSTLKVVTAVASLQEGLCTAETPVFCENGNYRFSGQTISDHNERYGLIPFRRVLEVSSNIGITKIARKLGREKLFHYMQNFGLGTPTTVELPGEASGILPPMHTWTEFATATIGFGQGVSVTTLQLACILSAVANGGELVKPRIVLGTLGSEGQTPMEPKRQVIRRVISPAVAAAVADILEGVVQQGSGIGARVEGIRIAGKTGTAQKSIPGVRGYAPGVYTSSFVGFWPKEAPQYVLVLVLEEPRESYWAGQSAAPIFGSVVERMTGLPSSPWNIRNAEAPDVPPKAKFIFSAAENTEAGPQGSGDSKVPRVLGLSLRRALEALARDGIEARVQGEGMVVQQFPAPGAKRAPGAVCFLTCAQPGDKGKSL
jgi:cell division protein FtsI (penicillin-binding protein 3)